MLATCSKMFLDNRGMNSSEVVSSSTMNKISIARRIDAEQITGKNNSKNKAENAFWIRCPICQGKTRTKIHADTVLINFPLYCPKCKRETLVNVVQLKMVVCETGKKSL